MESLAKEKILDSLEKSDSIISFVFNDKYELIKSNSGFDKLFIINASTKVHVIKNLFSTIIQNNSFKTAPLTSKIELPLYSKAVNKEVVLDLEVYTWVENEMTYYHCFGTDISDRYHHLLEMEKYRLIAQKTTSGVIITDAFGHVTWVNKGFTKMTGFSLEDILGKKPGALLQGKNTDKVTKALMHNAIVNGEPFEVEVLNYGKDGKEMWISIICDPIRNKLGELEGFIAIQPEITQRKLQEQKRLKENHDKFKAIFEKTINAIVLANDNMELIDLNPAACKMVGLPKEDIIGKSMLEFVSNGEAISNWDEFKEQGVQEGEIDIFGKQNRKAKYYAILNVLQDVHMSILQDITEQKIMQNSLQEKHDALVKTNQEKNKLFSIISHDLRSPLSRLAALLDLLKSGDLSEEEFKNFSNEISDNINDTANLLNNLLVWSNSMLDGFKTKPFPFNMHNVINEQLKLQIKTATEKGIICENLLEKNIEVFADENMMSIVLRNLISNAIKFCNEQDLISISAKYLNDTIEFCVADTGIGIPKENLNTIFSKELTTEGTNHEIGSGIGLGLCKDLIEQNNGHIRVESELGKGTKFYFTLPKA